MYLILLVALFLFISFTFYRYYVFKVGFANYFSFVLGYAALMRKSDAYLAKAMEVWPMRHWLFDFGCWEIDKYIINQDMYQEMIADMEQEAQKIIEKMKAIMDAKEEQAALPSSPPQAASVTSEDMLVAANEPIKQDLFTPPTNKPSNEEDHQG